MATIKDVYMAEKAIGYFPGWSKPESETDYIWFDAPLEIGGVTETGLVLHGGCYSRRPETHLTFELRIARTPGRRVMPIERLDWRCDRHSNPPKPKSPWSGKTVGATHLHDFRMNWSETEQRMRGGPLAMARDDLGEKVETFEQVRDFVGKRLNINNIVVVYRPDWVYDLLGWNP